MNDVYSEIHDYATSSLAIMSGIEAVNYWLVISTCIISGYRAALSTLRSFREELNPDEIEGLRQKANSYLKQQGKHPIEGKMY